MTLRKETENIPDNKRCAHSHKIYQDRKTACMNCISLSYGRLIPYIQKNPKKIFTPWILFIVVIENILYCMRLLAPDKTLQKQSNNTDGTSYHTRTCTRQQWFYVYQQILVLIITHRKPYLYNSYYVIIISQLEKHLLPNIL